MEMGSALLLAPVIQAPGSRFPAFPPAPALSLSLFDGQCGLQHAKSIMHGLKLI